MDHTDKACTQEHFLKEGERFMAFILNQDWIICNDLVPWDREPLNMTALDIAQRYASWAIERAEDGLLTPPLKGTWGGMGANMAWPEPVKGVPQTFMRSAMPPPGGGLLGMRDPLICHTINRTASSRRRSARRLIKRIAAKMRDGCVTEADRTLYFADEEYRDLHDYCKERGADLGHAMGDGELIINGRSLRLRIEPEDMSVYILPAPTDDDEACALNPGGVMETADTPVWFEVGRDTWDLYSKAPHTTMVRLGRVRPVQTGLLCRRGYQVLVPVGSSTDGALMPLTTERTMAEARAILAGRVS